MDFVTLLMWLFVGHVAANEGCPECGAWLRRTGRRAEGEVVWCELCDKYWIREKTRFIPVRGARSGRE